MRLRIALLVPLVVGTLLAPGCRREEPETPEDRVLAVLSKLEDEAQRHNVRAMRERVSDAYVDRYGNDKRRLVQIVAFHLSMNQAVHLLTRVQDVEIKAPGDARAVALVAMAGSPIDGPESLLSMRADLYRFDLRLREEDHVWRVFSAEWRPAQVADFTAPDEGED